jgi:hypothetical protein
VSFQSENFLTRDLICANVGPVAHELRLDLAAEVLQRFGQVRFIAQGSSMIPSIFPGDLITVRSRQVSGVSDGEIVLCVNGGRFFVHRMVSRQHSDRGRIAVATRGDALDRQDPLIDGTQLLGSVISVVRRGQPVRLPLRMSPSMQFLRWNIRNSSRFASIILAIHLLRSRMFDHQQASELAAAPGQSLGECA